MSLWAKIKFYALIAGGVAFLISLLLLRIFVMGSDSAKAANTVALGKAREKLDARLNKAHQAGDSVRRDTAAGGLRDADGKLPDDGYKRKRRDH